MCADIGARHVCTHKVCTHQVQRGHTRLLLGGSYGDRVLLLVWLYLHTAMEIECSSLYAHTVCLLAYR